MSDADNNDRDKTEEEYAICVASLQLSVLVDVARYEPGVRVSVAVDGAVHMTLEALAVWVYFCDILYINMYIYFYLNKLLIKNYFI